MLKTALMDLFGARPREERNSGLSLSVCVCVVCVDFIFLGVGGRGVDCLEGEMESGGGL